MGTVCDPVLQSAFCRHLYFYRAAAVVLSSSRTIKYNFFRGVAIVRRGRIGQISFRTDKFDVLHGGGKIVYLFIHTFRFLFCRRPTADGRSKRIAVRFSDYAYRGRRRIKSCIGTLFYNIIYYYTQRSFVSRRDVFSVYCFFFFVNTLRTRVDLQRLCRYILYRYYYYYSYVF